MGQNNSRTLSIMNTKQRERKFSLGIIDDHKLFAQSLKSLLHRITFIEHVTLYPPANANGFNVPKSACDLLLLDISMPYINGFEIFNKIRTSHPRQKIAFISSKEDRLSIQQALLLNADGYILKRDGLERLLDSLSQILIEEVKSFPDLPEKKLCFKNQDEVIAQPVKLSKREKEFFRELTFEALAIDDALNKNINGTISSKHIEKMLEKRIINEIKNTMSITKRIALAYRNSLLDKFETDTLQGLIAKGKQVLFTESELNK